MMDQFINAKKAAKLAEKTRRVRVIEEFEGILDEIKYECSLGRRHLNIKHICKSNIQKLEELGFTVKLSRFPDFTKIYW